MNPVRTAYIRDRVDLKGKRVADVGCGGGLLTVSLAQLGLAQRVLGVDASEASVEAAKKYAAKHSASVDFHLGTPEDLEPNTFDVVCAMEVIEHATNTDDFLDAVLRLLPDKGEGHLFLSTLDRTFASYVLGIVAAEHLFRLLPVGTHDWQKFQKPTDLAVKLGQRGFAVRNLSAINYLYIPPSTHRACLGPFIPNTTPNFILHAERLTC